MRTDPSSRSSQIAVLALPAVLLASLYLLLQRPGLVAATERASTSLADAKRRMPAPEVLAAATDRLFALRDEVHAEREAKRDAAATRAQAATVTDIPAGQERPVWMREFSELMRRHSIVVTSDRASEAAPVTIGGTGIGAPVRVRVLELRGAYGSMLHALEEFGAAHPGGRILDLAMKLDAKGGAPAWTLTIG